MTRLRLRGVTGATAELVDNGVEIHLAGPERWRELREAGLPLRQQSAPTQCICVIRHPDRLRQIVGMLRDPGPGQDRGPWLRWLRAIAVRSEQGMADSATGSAEWRRWRRLSAAIEAAG